MGVLRANVGGVWVDVVAATGPAGPAGPVGPAGTTGATGATGPTGATGSQGPTGAPGTSVVIKGSVASSAALTGVASPAIGDGWITADTGHLWIYIGPNPNNSLAKWNDVGLVQGPPGATGPAGPQGAQGPAGTAGATGSQGPAGTAGSTGPAGPGVPTGGATGTLLIKQSATDYNAAWGTTTPANIQVGFLKAVNGLTTDSDISAETYIYHRHGVMIARTTVASTDPGVDAYTQNGDLWYNIITFKTWARASGVWVLIAGPTVGGAGMTASGSTLNVVGGNGIIALADSVTLDTAFTDARYDARYPRKFVTDCGTGLTTTVTHAFGTRDVGVEVFRNSTPWDTVRVTVDRPNVNDVVVHFDTAPTLAQFRIVVSG